MKSLKAVLLDVDGTLVDSNDAHAQAWLEVLQNNVEALLRRLSGAGLRLVVASSATKDELRPLLELCGALPFIEHETSADDASHSL
jgi:phosphoglycolate phosphatase-like HAD superfamily hydrolase